MFPEQLKDCVEEFVKYPEINEVVPKFLHFWQYADVIERPIPSEMNIQHQRLTRWPSAGGYFANHPTLTDLSNGCDTACHPEYQKSRKVVDKYIFHVGGLKSLDFHKNKHEYYKKHIRAYLNQGIEKKLKGEMDKKKFLTYDGPMPKEIEGLKYIKIPTTIFPHWMNSAAYNGSIETIPLFTGMPDFSFLIENDDAMLALTRATEEINCYKTQFI